MNELDQMPLQPGMVVWANVRNPRENGNSLGKWRRVVIVERRGGHWRVMGITGSPRHATGRLRVPVPNFHAVGLSKPSYLWADHLNSVCAIDFDRPVGWIDTPLANAIADHAHLPYWQRRELLEVAARYHATFGTGAVA